MRVQSLCQQLLDLSPRFQFVEVCQCKKHLYIIHQDEHHIARFILPIEDVEAKLRENDYVVAESRQLDVA